MSGFESLNILIVESEKLTSHKLSNLKQTLTGNGCSKVTTVMNPELPYTHIIAEDTDFPEYRMAQDMMIPVVTPAWVHDSLDKQQTTRPYSPDPTHILKDVVITLSHTLPQQDREFLMAGIRALGGQFNEQLSKLTTHLAVTNSNEDSVIAISSIPDCSIISVVPSWILDCIKTRSHVDEKPYTVKPCQELPKRKRQVDALDPVQKRSQSYWSGHKFYLHNDLDLSLETKILLRGMIESEGGSVVTLPMDADVYMGKFRDGKEYDFAMDQGLVVGNINWFFYMVQHQEWCDPTAQLLHHPYPRDGIPGMSDFCIASTNYTGDARYYLLLLAQVSGAQFTKNFRPANNVLITAGRYGDKYNAAVKWQKAKIVNHLWLEETYAKGKVQDFDNPKYSDYSKRKRLAIGSTKLDMSVLKQAEKVDEFSVPVLDPTPEQFEPENGVDQDLVQEQALEGVLPNGQEETQISQADVLIPSLSPIPNTLVTSALELAQVPAASAVSIPQDIKTFESCAEGDNISSEKAPYSAPKPALHIDLDSSPNDVEVIAVTGRSTASTQAVSESIASRQPSGRRAKLKATEKLHDDIESLNQFQKHTSKSEMLPYEIEELELKRKIQKTASQDGTPSKKRKPTYAIHAVTTGIDATFSSSDLMILSSAGVNMHDQLTPEVNTIVANRVLRTEKFLIGMSHSLKYVLKQEFLQDVIAKFKANQPLPTPEDYFIEGITSDLLAKTGSNVLAPITQVNIASNLNGGSAVIERILKAHGVQNVYVVPNTRIAPIKDSEHGYVLITKSDAVAAKFKKAVGKTDKLLIVNWQWVVNCILEMKLQFEREIVYKRE